jgi:manganese/zinc/iron transport system permease protein
MDTWQWIWLWSPWLLPALGLTAATTAGIGHYAYAGRKSLAADAMAHAMLPGIACAFLLFQKPSTLTLILGGVLAGFIALRSIGYLSSIRGLRSDSSTALILSGGFSIGLVLLSYIQKNGDGAGLDRLMLGNAATLSFSYALWVLFVAFSTLLLHYRVGKYWQAMDFDPHFMRATGHRPELLKTVYSFWFSLVIATAVYAVGLILVTAWISLPALTLQNLRIKPTYRPASGALLAGVCTIIAALISLFFPYWPIAPTAALMMGILFFSTFLIHMKMP